MKQHITEEQLDELSSKKRNVLHKVWRNNGQVVNLLNHTDINIGTMIEFLGDEIKCLEFEVDMWFLNSDYEGIKSNERELCDTLWQAVKEVLETL